MPISPSRREEIRTLTGKLAGPDLETARGAAARLIVIGPRAFEALRELAAGGLAPGARRALSLMPFLREPRAVELLAALSREAGSDPSRPAALLAAEGSAAAARALAESFRERRSPVLLAALEVMALRGSAPAEEALAGLLGDPGRPPQADWQPLVEELRLEVEARVEDPLGRPDAPPGAAGASGAAPSVAPLDAYLALQPDAPGELEARRQLAADGAGADGAMAAAVAARLQEEELPSRLGLLALLAGELADARLLVPLREAVLRAQDAWRREAPGEARDAAIAAEARGHMALARLGSRAAVTELDRSLRSLAPEEIRVEHLGALELIGSRPELPALVGLCSTPGWLGDGALRVLAAILKREGLSTRVAPLRPLDPGRRRVLRELLATA